MFNNEKNNKRLDKDTARVIKVGKEALFEYVYEHFIGDTETLFNVDSLSVVSSMDMNFENGEFICCIYDDGDDDIHMFDYANKLDLQKVMKKIPNTTASLHSSENLYREFTKDELLKLSE